ncbi:MAG: MFS transporter [Bryobacterales bacterium]|nr:MFS transporter [Bryobacterales bacterium]
MPESDSRRWPVVWLLFAGILIAYVDRGNLSLAAVPVMRDLSLSPTEAGTLMSAFFWTYGLFQFPAGWIIDRYGLRGTYALAFLVWSVASAAMGLAQTFGQILALRLVLGLGEAIAAPASLAYIKRHFGEQEQGLPTGIYISGLMLGPAVGALLGGMLIETMGWRPLFVLTGLAACIWLLPWWRWAPRDTPRTSAVQAAPAAAKMPGIRIAAGLGISAFFYSYFWYFCLTWLPSYLVMTRGFSFGQMGTWMAMPLAAMAVSAMIWGRVADRMVARGAPALAVRRRFAGAGMLAGCSMLLVLLAQTPNQVLAVLMVSLTGVGLAGANYWAITQCLATGATIGRLVGYQNTLAQAAGATAPLLTGFLIERMGGFTPAIVVAGASPLLAFAAIMLLRQPDPR